MTKTKNQTCGVSLESYAHQKKKKKYPVAETVPVVVGFSNGRVAPDQGDFFGALLVRECRSIHVCPPFDDVSNTPESNTRSIC